MAGTIGIKIANGDFYPITGENISVKKRLVLTTVHDNQNSVQIDLFHSISKSMLDAHYIGSLIVENIRQERRGEPSIEMIISSDENGNITAHARDLAAGKNGDRHILNVSLKTLDKEILDDDFSDFDLNRGHQMPSGLLEPNEQDQDEVRKFPWLIMVIATVFVIVVIGLLWFFFLDGRDILSAMRPTAAENPPIISIAPPRPQTVQIQPEPPVPPPQIPPSAPAQVQPELPVPSPVTEPAASVIEPPVIKAPDTPPPSRPETIQRKRPPAPVSSYRVPAVIPRNGVVYQISWGDTLWDISAAFYRNPWLYPRIAEYNKILNPDHIIAGSNVRIPPLN